MSSSIFEKSRSSSIFVFHLRRPRIVLLWLRAWRRLISLLFRVAGGWVGGGWVAVGGIGTKVSPSILLLLRALQKNTQANTMTIKCGHSGRVISLQHPWGSWVAVLTVGYQQAALTFVCYLTSSPDHMGDADKTKTI
jgi:hypothetical protein